MPHSACLIACSNGLGHVRRSVLIGNELENLGIAVTLFAPDISIKRVVEALGIGREFHSVDFDTYTSAETLCAGNSCSLMWEQRLPNMENFDIVISDNLPEILAVRSDSWLSGNFLWHEALPNISPQYRMRALNLIDVNQPHMLSFLPFSSIENSKNVKSHWCAMPQVNAESQSIVRDSLLISSGTGGEIAHEYKNFIDSLISSERNPFRVVYVEPELLPPNRPEWMQPAKFTQAMFSTLIATICRPGFGIIADCIEHSVRMFLVFEHQNREMHSNSNSLQLHGCGTQFESCEEAFHVASQFALNQQDYDVDHMAEIKAAAMDGPTAAQLISDYLNNKYLS